MSQVVMNPFTRTVDHSSQFQHEFNAEMLLFDDFTSVIHVHFVYF